MSIEASDSTAGRRPKHSFGPPWLAVGSAGMQHPSHRRRERSADNRRWSSKQFTDQGATIRSMVGLFYCCCRFLLIAPQPAQAVGQNCAAVFAVVGAVAEFEA